MKLIYSYGSYLCRSYLFLFSLFIFIVLQRKEVLISGVFLVQHVKDGGGAVKARSCGAISKIEPGHPCIGVCGAHNSAKTVLVPLYNLYYRSVSDIKATTYA